MLSQDSADAFYLRQLLYTRTLNLRRTTKVTKQRSTALWTHSFNTFQNGLSASLTSAVSMRGDSKPMTFVTNVLN